MTYHPQLSSQVGIESLTRNLLINEGKQQNSSIWEVLLRTTWKKNKNQKRSWRSTLKLTGHHWHAVKTSQSSQTQQRSQGSKTTTKSKTTLQDKNEMRKENRDLKSIHYETGGEQWLQHIDKSNGIQISGEILVFTCPSYTAVEQHNFLQR